MTTQPEALRWAGILQHQAQYDGAEDYKNKAADELRRLHESNTELLAALKLVSETDLEGADARAMYLIFEAIKHKAQTAINKAERTTT